MLCGHVHGFSKPIILVLVHLQHVCILLMFDISFLLLDYFYARGGHHIWLRMAVQGRTKCRTIAFVYLCWLIGERLYATYPWFQISAVVGVATAVGALRLLRAVPGTASAYRERLRGRKQRGSALAWAEAVFTCWPGVSQVSLLCVQFFFPPPAHSSRVTMSTIAFPPPSFPPSLPACLPVFPKMHALVTRFHLTSCPHFCFLFLLYGYFLFWQGCFTLLPPPHMCFLSRLHDYYD